MYQDDHSRTIHNSPKLETTQMPISSRMDKNINSFCFSEGKQFDHKLNMKYPGKPQGNKSDGENIVGPTQY